MQLLVSPRCIEGAKNAIAGGADIIDCKNPDEGSLGAHLPSVIKEMHDLARQSTRDGVMMSATIGDMPFLPGTASLAAAGLAAIGVDFVKVGVLGPRTAAQATSLLSGIVGAVRDISPRAKVVAAGYADHQRLGSSIPPLELVGVAAETGCDVVMVDTSIKDGKGLRDHMDDEEITRFCDAAKESQLSVALAGQLAMEDIPFLNSTGVDIIGVRSLVCTNGNDRVTGIVDERLVRELKALVT